MERLKCARQPPAAIGLLGLLLFGTPSIQAAPEPRSLTGPALVQIAPGRFQFGKIEMNRSNHSLTLPVEINQREGLVEYFLVHEQGKTHESLFRTSVRPHEIHLAYLLLSDLKPGQSAAQPIRLRIFVQGPRAQEFFEPGHFVGTNRQAQFRATLDWQYRTPMLEEGIMAAEKDGSIVSFIRDERSLIQNLGPGSENDEIWWVRGDPGERLKGKISLELTFLPHRSGDPSLPGKKK